MFSTRNKIMDNAFIYMVIGTSIYAYDTNSELNLAPTLTDINQESPEVSPQEMQRLMAGTTEAVGHLYRVTNQVLSSLETKKPATILDIKQAVEQIKQFQQAFDDAIKHIFQIPPTSQLDMLDATAKSLTICNAYLQEMQAAIKNNFANGLNKDCLITKDGMGLEESETEQAKKIESLLGTIQIYLDSIPQTCELIGLGTRAKICRAISSYLIDPFYKYELYDWLPIAGATGLLAVYVYWNYFCPRSGEVFGTGEHKSFTKDLLGNHVEAPLRGQTALDAIKDGNTKISYNWFQKSISRWLKLAPSISPAGHPEIHELDRFAINNGLLTVRQVMAGLDPLQVGLAGLIATKLSTKIKEIKSFGIRYIKMLWNRAKGGVYTELPIEGNYIEMPRYTIDDAIGMKKIKERLAEAISYAINPAPFRNSGKIPCCNFIFHGETRSGKSFFAECIAGTIMRASSLPYKFIKLPVTALMSWGAKAAIEFIQSHAPCIAFIDEFDLAGPLRANNTAFVHELLITLGQGESINKDPYKPVILITAGNKLEGFDRALRTTGRLGTEIPFEYPHFDDRYIFISSYLAKNALNPDEFDIVRLAQKTRRRSYEKIEECLKHGINKGRLAFEGNVIQQNLEEAVDETLYSLHHHLVPYELIPEMRELLAAHFAGRAVALMLTKGLETLDVVSINKFDIQIQEDAREAVTGNASEQKKQDYGILLTRSFADDIVSFVPPMALHAEIMQLVAGAVAEEILLGHCTNTCHQYSTALAFWKAMVLESNGLYQSQIEQLPKAEKERISRAALQRLNQCKQDVKLLLEKHKVALQLTSDLLGMFGTLDDRRIHTILSEQDKAKQLYDDVMVKIKDASSRDNEQEIAAAIQMLMIGTSSPRALNDYIETKQKETAQEAIASVA